MRKIKRIAITMLMGLTACVLAVGLSACNTVKKGEREWTDSTEVVHTHEFGSWVTDKPATCDNAGSQSRVCKDAECGEKETQVIAAKGHTIKTLDAVAATCTTPGKTEGKKCSDCGAILTAQNETPALGHDVDCSKSPLSKSVTCMSKAFCGVCGQEYGEKIVHVKPDLVYFAGQEPTCVSPGWKDYQLCTICNCTNKEVLPARGHDSTHPDSRNASCTEKAYCGVCKVEYGDEPSHDFDLSYQGYLTDKTKSPSALPTCTTSAFCGYCQSYYGEPLGHEMAWIDARPATCVDAGWDMHQACTRDGCTHNTKVVVPALGHIEVDIVAIAPTCTEIGRTAGTQCERCSWMSAIPQTLSALGHDGQRVGQYVAADFVDEDSYFADCTRRAYCGICDSEYGDEPVYGLHTFRTIEAQNPTCSAEGWNEYQICKYCNYSTYEENRIPMVPHTPRYFPAVEPTCTTQGNEEATICIACEQLTVIPALGHDGYRYDYEKGEKLPIEHPNTIVGNCTTQSYCGICGTYGPEAEGHTPRKGATCTTKAECAICGEEYGEPRDHMYIGEVCVLCGANNPAIFGKRKGDE